MVVSACFDITPANNVVESQVIEQNRIDENKSSSDFAQLLAGLLSRNKTENEVTSIPLDDFSGNEIDLDGLIDENQVFANQDFANLVFAQTTETPKISAENNFSEISAEHYNTLHSAENILSSLNAIDTNEAAISFQIDEKTSNLQFENQELPAYNPQNNPVAEQFNSDEIASLTRAAANMDGIYSERKNNRNETSSQLAKAEQPEINPENIRSIDESAPVKQEQQSVAENSSRFDEARSRNDRFSLEVHDHRTAEQNSHEMQLAQTMESSRMHNSGQEITLELRLPDAQAQHSAQTTWETKAGTALENMLARELHQNFNGDIVRHASIALHNGGEGVIKLALRPDSLGNVKIHLKMSENKITGYIIVESEEALNAFRREIASLEKAFRDSGFADANLDLSMASDGKNDWNEQDANSFLPRMAASRYDDSFIQRGQDAQLVEVLLGQRLNINMYA